MERMTIKLPTEWKFETEIEVRVTDLNYGNHLANQHFLGYAHEARLRYYISYGFTEKDFGGLSLIQADAAIIYKVESFYGDRLRIQISARQRGRASFDLFYLISRSSDDKVLAEMRTAMVCYDYEKGKPAAIPELVLSSGILD